jgi:D-alanine transaminase
LVTRHADHAILRGITRTVVMDVIKAQALAVEERAFKLDEAFAAREAFVTSASQIVLPVVSIDGRTIGDGKPGPVAISLRRKFHRYAETG